MLETETVRQRCYPTVGYERIQRGWPIFACLYFCRTVLVVRLRHSQGWLNVTRPLLPHIPFTRSALYLVKSSSVLSRCTFSTVLAIAYPTTLCESSALPYFHDKSNSLRASAKLNLGQILFICYLYDFPTLCCYNNT